jgi:hypothetical protein
MDHHVCALAAETKVETPEGPLTVRGLAGKSVPAFTRDDNGRVRFRMMQNIRKVAEQVPVLKITLETGGSFRVAADQVLYRKGMVETRAADLGGDDSLEPMFHYPEGYQYRDSDTGAECESTQAVRVVGVEDGGSADVYALAVSRTGCFFVAAGILCKAESAS